MSSLPGYFGRLILMPGVIIHELSHYLVCKLFFIKVTAVRLFIFDPTSQTLGYVNSSYETSSLFQRIGETFSGIAPLFGITEVVTGLYWKMFPKSIHQIHLVMQSDNSILQQYKLIANQIIHSILDRGGVGIAFIVIVLILMTGFALSPADLSTATTGLIPLIVIIAAITILSLYAPVVVHLSTLAGMFILLVSLTLIVFASVGAFLLNLI